MITIKVLNTDSSLSNAVLSALNMLRGSTRPDQAVSTSIELVYIMPEGDLTGVFTRDGFTVQESWTFKGNVTTTT